MPYRQLDSIKIFQFASLEGPGLIHAVLTRHGGVSPAPWDALNVGSTVGDDPARVRRNKRLALDALGRPEASLFEVWQVHSAVIVEATSPRGDRDHVQADGIITNVPGVTLMMRFADCVPVVLYDPGRRAAGIVHAGWLGTVRQAAAEGVRALARAYGCRPEDVRAGIGPSIGPDHYAIGADVEEQVRGVFGDAAEGFLRNGQDGWYLDLWSANRWLLEREGVSQIEVAGICTACDPGNWYSHRGEHGRTGRFGALVALAAGAGA